MVFSRIPEIISIAATRFLAPKSSNTLCTAPGLPPLSGSQDGFGFHSSGKKIFFRSSSLQEFSAYSRLDPEEGDLNSEVSRNLGYAKQVALQRENAGSRFPKEKISPGSPRRRKWKCVFLVLLCLLLVAFLLYILQYSYFNWAQGASKFYVVLDCGSTGTRVYVYQASINHKKDGSLPISVRSLPETFHRKSSLQSGRAYNRMETEPGFDKLVHNISGLRGAIKPLVQWAKKQIPRNAHKSTFLFLYATAGLRRLPSADSEWLLNNAWSILKDSPFSCKREWVKIISGMEEAYYGWIALNYHTGTLGVIPNKGTLGALDLGGSSLQVTFESEADIHSKTSLKLSIGQVNHQLNAYSLSGYGLNDAFDRSVVHLVKRLPKISRRNVLNGKVEIKHPCLQSGYKGQYICSHCASALQGGKTPNIKGKELGKGGKPGVAVQLIGAPKWEECRALAKVAVNFSEWSDKSPGIDCDLQPCAIAENLPRPHGQFFAMSGFYVVYRFFNLTPDAALEDVLEKGHIFCEKTWNAAKNSVQPQPFIEQYCFRAPYIVFLLREGLHITDTYVTIGSGSITWTLGVALLEAGKTVSTGMEFHSYQILRMKISLDILLGILIFSLFLLLIALSCVNNSMPKYFRRLYLSLFRHNSSSSALVLSVPTAFRFQRWSSMSLGDGRVKMPLSPTTANTPNSPFDTGGTQLRNSSLYRSSSGVGHSYSSDSLGQMQFDGSALASYWTPHRNQMQLQSRRSQSREDLNFSLAEAHLVKV